MNVHADRVTIVEVGPRDGLQAESFVVDTATKVDLVDRLARTGIGTVEVTSFVAPNAVPQMADAEQVFTSFDPVEGVRYPVLIPNLRGYERARQAAPGSGPGTRLTDIAVFASASESFSRRNINASIAESVERYRPVIEVAKLEGVRVRGYVSMAFGCPYEGAVEPAAVADVVANLMASGVDHISLGDTIGCAVPSQIAPLCAAIFEVVARDAVALHLHDTRGSALANVWEALSAGIRTFDASVAGLGGCPFADGAAGNVATEDLVWMLEQCGVHTGVDLDALIEVSTWVSAALGRPSRGRVATAPRWPLARR